MTHLMHRRLLRRAVLSVNESPGPMSGCQFSYNCVAEAIVLLVH